MKTPTIRLLYTLTALLLALCLSLSCAAAEGFDEDLDYWQTTLETLVYEIGPRSYESIGEEMAKYFLEEEFAAMGYSYDDGTLLDQGDDAYVNKVALLPAGQQAENILIVCAHYDTVIDTAGAKDNASGLAAMLTLARRFAAEGPYPLTELRFIAFAGEERGEAGSGLYCASLTPEERERVLAVVNIDILAVDAEAQDVALSCNTLGARTKDGYTPGSPEAPAANTASRAFEKALWQVGSFQPGDRDVTFCLPRHWGDGDHIPFHDNGIDAATVCFQGNVAAGGCWPAEMHSPDDYMGDFDRERTREALQILYTALSSLAADPAYGA